MTSTPRTHGSRKRDRPLRGSSSGRSRWIRHKRSRCRPASMTLTATLFSTCPPMSGPPSRRIPRVAFPVRLTSRCGYDRKRLGHHVQPVSGRTSRNRRRGRPQKRRPSAERAVRKGADRATSPTGPLVAFGVSRGGGSESCGSASTRSPPAVGSGQLNPTTIESAPGDRSCPPVPVRPTWRPVLPGERLSRPVRRARREVLNRTGRYLSPSSFSM